jgi:hypothetical protein
MNCSEFQEIVQDLARIGGSEAAERERGLAHARMCARCDAILIEAASLSSSLRALAATYARAEAPARVEAALLEAYRQRCVTQPKLVRVRWRVPAALAGLAMAAGLAIAVLLYHPAGHSIRGQAIAVAAVASSASAPANENPGSLRSGRANGGSAEDAPAAAGKEPVTAASAAKPENAGNEGTFEDISATSGTFMPLPYTDEIPIENATVVRAVLPSRALGAFGLPVTDGAADGTVVADFIVGEDGTPEAIRVVR